MAKVRQNEVLGKALPSDTAVIPRFNIKAADGTTVAENATIELTNPVITEGMAVDKTAMDECLSASGRAGGTKTALTLQQENYALFDGAVVRVQLFDQMSGAATLNVNGTGAKRIKTLSGEDPDGLTKDSWVDLVYSQVRDQYIIQGGGGSAALSQNINLLEELIDMKYLKLLTTQQQNPDAAFAQDAWWMTGMKHPTAGWSCYVKSGTNSPRSLVFRAKLSSGKYTDFALQLPTQFIVGLENVGSSNYWFYNHGITSGNNNALLMPVTNKPNEVCLKINCTTRALYYSSSSSTSGSSFTESTWRIYAVFDVTTGENKITYITWKGSSYGTRSDSIQPNSNWCYYNTKFDTYYIPGAYQISDTATAYLGCFKTGTNYVGNGTSDSSYFYTSIYFGQSNSAYDYYQAFPFFVNDTTLLYVETQGTTIRLTRYTLTAYKTFSSSVLFSTDDSSLFYGSRASSYRLFTVVSGKCYVYFGARSPSSSESNYYWFVRLGPFSNTSTSWSKSTMYKLLATYPQNNFSEGYIRPVALYENDPDKVVFSTDYPYRSSDIFAPTLYRVYDEPSMLLYGGPPLYYGNLCYTRTQFPTCQPWWACGGDASWLYMLYDYANVYLGDFTDEAAEQYWECPEDGIYKLILVGGGAAGAASFGGGAGYLTLGTRAYTAGQRVPYKIGRGETYQGTSPHPLDLRNTDRSTTFDDLFALPGVFNKGGATGAATPSGGGAGGYDLVQYGGQGMNYIEPTTSGSSTVILNNAALMKDRNGGTSANSGAVTSGDGYGAGGGMNQNGKDGCIVIIR